MDIKRIREKNKFVYFRGGVPVTDKDTLDRINKLRIPPAWEDVCISNSPISHLQAMGRDTKKVQYLYHPMWVVLSDHDKYKRMYKFASGIKKLENSIKIDILSSDELKKEMAVIFRILYHTYIRVGNEQYAKDNKTYGLVTLEKRHVGLVGRSGIRLSFVGKKSVQAEKFFNDVHVYNYLSSRLPKLKNGDRIFPSMSGAQVNKYLQDIIGDEFTAKDFRTYYSNILFIKGLAALPITGSLKRNLIETYDKVASKLGHTRAISKKSYVMPIIAQQYIINPSQFYNKNPDIIFKSLIHSYY